MADLKNLTFQFKNPQTNESYEGHMRTSEDMVMLADGTTLRDLKEALWDTIATQAYQMLQHKNAPHLTTQDLADIIANVTYDDTTGTLTVERCSGETADIASGLNKSVSKFEKFVATAADEGYIEGHTILRLELVNGDTYGVDLVDFVNDNIKINDTVYTASYTETPADLHTDVANYAKNVSFAPDPASAMSAKICTGETCVSADGNTTDTIGFTMTGSGDCSTARAKLLYRKVSDAKFSTKDFISDGNTTPKFSTDMTYELDKWYEIYFVICDTVAGISDVVVYRSNTALIKHTSLAVNVNPDPDVNEDGGN